MKTNSTTYAEEGVDIARADRAKQRIKLLARKTFNKNVLADISSFGAFYPLPAQAIRMPPSIPISVRSSPAKLKLGLLRQMLRWLSHWKDW